MLSVGMQSGMLLLPGGWVIEVPQDKWLVQSDTPTQDSILAVQLHAWVLGEEVTNADGSLHFSEAYFLLFLGSWESASQKAVRPSASQSVPTFFFAHRTFTVSRSPTPMHLRESWLLPHPEGKSCRQPEVTLSPFSLQFWPVRHNRTYRDSWISLLKMNTREKHSIFLKGIIVWWHNAENCCSHLMVMRRQAQGQLPTYWAWRNRERERIDFDVVNWVKRTSCHSRE